MCVCVCVCIYIYRYIYICTPLHTPEFVHVYVFSWPYKNIYAQLYIYREYVCMYVCV